MRDRILLDLCGGRDQEPRTYADSGYDVRVITLSDSDVHLFESIENVYGILAAPFRTEF